MKRLSTQIYKYLSWHWTFDALLSCFSWRKKHHRHLESNTETKKSTRVKASKEACAVAAQRGRRACNFNYGYQRVSLIAGSPTRSPHVITLWFDFFPRGITNGYRRGRARCCRTAFLFVSLVATFCTARRDLREGRKGRGGEKQTENERQSTATTVPSV